MVNKIFSLLLIIPAFASIMLFSTFMTPVSAGTTGGPDFIGVPVDPVILNIDLSNPVPNTLLQEVEIKEGFRLPPDPEWEPSSLIETTASETNYKASSVQQPLVRALDGTFGNPVLSFEGIPFTGARPPDTNGDVGPNHYIQMVNTQFQIFDKLGVSQAGPSNINSLWVAANTNDNCENFNAGDPIVQYDHLADRWLMSQFTLPGAQNQCIAISQTADPVAGGWFLYNFPMPVNNDYFKFGVWPDAYYMGTNAGYPNGHAWAFDRTNMLLGNAATFQAFTLQTDGSIMLPSNLDGPPPPAGAPNVFMRFVEGGEFGGADRLELTEFHVDFATPALSTFTPLPDLPTTAFDSVLCSLVPDPIGVACIPQPGTTQELDTLRGFTMYPLQYRNFGTDETLVVTHNVDADGNDLAGVRWYEVRKEAGVWSIFQQGTYSPDNTHRWIGSAAMDSCRNIALGYSVTSGTVFPGISYAGRIPTDPLGTMPQGEYSLIAGTGSQTNSFRYGDYSSMTIDPVDDRSFWYTSEYINANGNWQTRIAQLTFDTCIEFGDINGFKYEDVDANGVFDAGTDVPLENWQICIFLPGEESDPIDAEVCGLTDANGEISFDGLVYGDYVACETVQNLWSNVSDVCQNVTIDEGNQEPTVNFANWKDVTIMGEKWEDTDADGIDNANAEPRLADWEIKLTHEDGTVLTTTTADGSGSDALGKYTFGPLGPEWAGNAQICETVQPGWIPSHPDTGCIDIAIESGGDLGATLPDDDTDFGNILAIEAEKTWTHTDYNWGPICALFNTEPPFNCLEERPRETDIPSDEVLAETLPFVNDKYEVSASIHPKNDKFQNTQPGAFYALTTVDVLADINQLTVWEDYGDLEGDCTDSLLKLLAPNHKPTRAVKVAIANSDKQVTELTKSLYDDGSITADDDSAHVELNFDIEAGSTVYVLVKFEDDLKGEKYPNGIMEMCHNEEKVMAEIGELSPAEVIAEADLRIQS